MTTFRAAYRVTTAAFAAFVALVAVLLLPTHAEADVVADRVVDCATVKTPSGRHVTTLEWDSGRATRHLNLSARSSRFPGRREVQVMPKVWKGLTVVRCRVRPDGRVAVKTVSRARYHYVQPPVPALVPVIVPEPVQTAPSPAAPAIVATWDRPVVLYSTVDASWEVEAAAAAWNTALPADRQITVSSSDCSLDTTVGCVVVEEYDFINEWPYTDARPAGAAWPDYSDGRMYGCRVGLNATDPLSPYDSRLRIATHEIGHCLGLPHWTTDGPYAWTIMSNVSGAHRVTSWDLEWLARSYGL